MTDSRDDLQNLYGIRNAVQCTLIVCIHYTKSKLYNKRRNDETLQTFPTCSSSYFECILSSILIMKPRALIPI